MNHNPEMVRTVMTTTILPCPFCGRQPSEQFCQRRYDFDFAIECECGACMSMCELEGGTRERTIAQWNTRVAAGRGRWEEILREARQAVFARLTNGIG